MDELGLRGDASQDVVQGNKSATMVWVAVEICAATAFMAIALISLWNHYTAKFGEINHVADSLVTGERRLMAVPSSAGDDRRTGARIPIGEENTLETIYRNAPTGVTLRLPGAWRSVATSDIQTPSAAHRFCILSSQDTELTAMFWPIFPDLQPSLEADANALRTAFTINHGLIFKAEKKLKIRGTPARELQFVAPVGGLNLNLLIVRKWPVTYLLAITGRAKARETWEHVENALGESIEIQ